MSVHIAQTEPRPAARDWATHAALLVVQVAFASQAVEAKIAMAPRGAGGEAIAPEAVAMTRMLAAAVFFQVFTRSTRQLAKTPRRELLALAGLSILGIALNQTLFLIGLRLTTPMSAALLGVTIPVITAALAVAFGKERATWRMGLGLLVASAGVVVLTGITAVDRGALIVVANCFAYSAYVVFSRDVVIRLGALTVNTWIFTWGALLFLPIGGHALAAGAPHFTPRGWAYLGYIVAVPTIVAYLANAWALGRSSATLVATYIYSQPVLTALIAWVQLGQVPAPRAVLAGALIAVGVAVVARR